MTDEREKTEREERLIAALEAVVNGQNRLIQLLERQRARKVARAQRVRAKPRSSVKVTPEAEAIAKRQLSRILGE